MRIGILTGGGDVPGLTPCIKAVVTRAEENDWGVIRIRRGWAGLLRSVPVETSTQGTKRVDVAEPYDVETYRPKVAPLLGKLMFLY